MTDATIRNRWAREWTPVDSPVEWCPAINSFNWDETLMPNYNVIGCRCCCRYFHSTHILTNLLFAGARALRHIAHTLPNGSRRVCERATMCVCARVCMWVQTQRINNYLYLTRYKWNWPTASRQHTNKNIQRWQQLARRAVHWQTRRNLF